ncbi:MAG: hypothetical protein NXI03_03050, partial [Alphaproteobacteria bacterium]|nr:hypothetical protein [Alphaproteobacteria bacterium]
AVFVLVFLPHSVGKWAEAKLRVDGAARQRRLPAPPASLSTDRVDQEKLVIPDECPASCRA